MSNETPTKTEPRPTPAEVAEEALGQILQQHSPLVWSDRFLCRCSGWSVSRDTDEMLRDKLWSEHVSEFVLPAVAAAIAARDRSWEEELRAARESKDGAYRERDMLVAALSKMYPASLERHSDSDLMWENDWRWIVFIDLPSGQVTWHIHDSELSLFDHLPRFQDRKWDGHTRPEKYERLANIL